MRQPSPVKTARDLDPGFTRESGTHTIGIVVNQVEAGLVVEGSHVCLGNSETDGVREALTERTSSDLDAVGVTSLWVTRSQRVELTERLEVVKRQLEAKEVEEDILEGATA